MKPEQLAKIPKYEIRALKIKRIRSVLHTVCDAADRGAGSITVSKEFMEKYKPEAGDYVLIYPNGSKAYAPASVFEANNVEDVEES